MNRVLSKSEERDVLSLSSLNERRDFVQNLAVNFLAHNKKSIFVWTTGSGKTKIGIKSIEKCKKKFGGSYIIVVPDLRLKQAWENDTKHIDNCYVYVVNSFTMSNVFIPDDVKMVVYDECHHYANKDSMYFSQAIKKINAKWHCCLSATLNANQLQYLYSLGFSSTFTLDINTALRLGLVIPYRIYNLGIEFTDEEKELYAKYQTEYKNHLYYFEQYLGKINYPNVNYASVLATCLLVKTKGIVKFNNVVYKNVYALAEHVSSVVGINSGVLFYKAKMWEGQRSKRNHLLHNAQNKLTTANELLNMFDKQKVVVFTNTKKNAEILVKQNKHKRQRYYSGKDGKDILERFFDFKFPHLVTIRKCDEGDLDNEVGIGINLTHQSESRSLKQRLGKKFAPTYLNEES